MPELHEIPPRCEFDMDKLVIELDEIVPSVVGMIDGVVAKITGLIEQTHCWGDTESLDLVLREALANAIIHGNRSNPQKSARVCVALQADCRMLIVVKDAGAGFDPSELPNPVTGQGLFAEHGRGIFLINRLMENVQFNFDRGTAIYMRRTLAEKVTAIEMSEWKSVLCPSPRNLKATGASQTVEGRVISKCANPACTTLFRYLHEGRLFCFGDAPGAARWSGGIPFRWLCNKCSSTMTLCLDRNGEVILHLVSADGAHPNRNSEIRSGIAA